jgi:hypothetical protein
MGSRVGEQSPRRLVPVIIPVAVTLLAAAGARAAQPGYEISVGVIESDNIQRLNTGGTHDTIIEQEFQLQWAEQRPRLDASVNADLSHLTYVPRTFADEVVGNLIGQGRFALIQQALFWNISDNFGQGSTNPLAAVTPTTRENINYFNTGPEALLPLGGSANLLALKANYGRVNYQKSPLDSQRYSGGVGFVHRLSPSAEVSFNVSDERVNYSNNTVTPDYSSQEAFAHFDAKGARTVLALDVGYGRLVEPNSTPGNVIARLELTRKMSASSNLSFAFGHEYSDAAAAFQVSQALGGANLNTQSSVVQTGAPFTTLYETLGWNFLRNRTGLGISASHFKDTYQLGGNLNDTRLQADANISRQLTPTLQAALIEQYLRQTFENVAGNSTESTTDARVTWKLGRHVSLFLDYQHSLRHSQVAASQYTENRIWLSIGYGRPAQQLPGPPTPPLPYSVTY